MLELMVARTFRARLMPPGEPGETSFFVVPFDVKEAFGKARPPVEITIKRHSYRTTVAVYGGKYYVVAKQAVQQATGLAPGDDVDVTMALDEAPRTISPPPDLAAALRKSRLANDGWKACSYTHKKEHADAILGAKKPETRVRRVEVAVVMLTALAEKRAAAGKKRATPAKPAPGAPRKT